MMSPARRFKSPGPSLLQCIKATPMTPVAIGMLDDMLRCEASSARAETDMLDGDVAQKSFAKMSLPSSSGIWS